MDADKLEFTAVQIYDRGDVVRWVEDTPASGPGRGTVLVTLPAQVSLTFGESVQLPPGAYGCVTPTASRSTTGTPAIRAAVATWCGSGCVREWSRAATPWPGG